MMTTRGEEVADAQKLHHFSDRISLCRGLPECKRSSVKSIAALNLLVSHANKFAASASRTRAGGSGQVQASPQCPSLGSLPKPKYSKHSYASAVRVQRPFSVVGWHHRRRRANSAGECAPEDESREGGAERRATTRSRGLQPVPERGLAAMKKLGPHEGVA